MLRGEARGLPGRSYLYLLNWRTLSIISGKIYKIDLMMNEVNNWLMVAIISFSSIRPAKAWSFVLKVRKFVKYRTLINRWGFYYSLLSTMYIMKIEIYAAGSSAYYNCVSLTSTVYYILKWCALKSSPYFLC